MAHPAVHPLLILREADRVRLRLQRVGRCNALDLATLRELAEVLAEGDPLHRPLVLDGDGGVFSLGADIRELAGFSGEQAVAYSLLGQRVVQLLEAWPGVTIAQLDNYALGTGLELALGCDVLIGHPAVRLGLPGLAWAMVPCFGGLRRLQQRVGPALATDLFLRGEVLDGEAGLFAGLLDRLVEDPASLNALVTMGGDFGPGAVSAIRSLRLDRHGQADAAREAAQFSAAFISGECQRRLRTLL